MSRVALIIGGVFSILSISSYTIVDQEFHNVSPLNPGPDSSPGLVPGMYLWGLSTTDQRSYTGFELAIAPHAPLHYHSDSIASGNSTEDTLHGLLKRAIQKDKTGALDSDESSEGCDPTDLPDLSNSFALVKHGKCSLFTKMINCQNKGAKAIIISGNGLPIGTLEAMKIPALIVTPTEFEELSDIEGQEAFMWTLPPDLDFSLARLAVLSFVRPSIMLSILLIIFVANIRGQSKRRRSPPEVVGQLPTYYWRRISPPNAWDQQQCSICLEDFEENCELMVLPCGHEFHKNCVAQWLIFRRGACPLCWHEIPSETTELLP